MKSLSLVGYLLVIALSVGLVSCSKDDDGGGFKGTKKLVTVTYNDGSYHKFKYDSQGRIIECNGSYVWWNRDVKYTFEYFPDKIIVLRRAKYYTDTYIDTDTYTYKLEDGVIVSSYYVDDHLGVCEEVYSYDKDKQLIKIQRTEGQSFSYETFTWAGGNITTTYHSYESYPATYSYSDIPNRFIGIADEDIDEEILLHWGYLGKTPKNLVSKIEQTNSSPNVENYIYEFDSEGYVTKVIIRGGGGYNHSCTLTYED
jgi:hypothetical protein